MRWMTLVIIVLALPTSVGATQPCEVVPMPCTFEGRPFLVTVVDAETREPLGGVHVLAEWQVYGARGRRNGPLMVKDVVSGADGIVAVEGWGPIDGPVVGMVTGYDPGLTFFKPGYEVLVVPNLGGPPAREHERVRRFFQDGQTLQLTRFRGTPEQWAAELAKAARPLATPMADQVRLEFRSVYLNRLYRVRAERERLPEPIRSDGKWFGLLEAHIRLLERTP